MAMQSNMCRPPVPEHPARLRERYERMVRSAGGVGRVITRPSGGRVHVIEAGDGPPVVHLHGNNTSSLSHLTLLEHLTEVRSFLVDRPGSGLSDPETFPRGSFRPCAVRFVDDVLDALGLESAVLAGASGGGVSCSDRSRCSLAPGFLRASGCWRRRCWATSSVGP